jgi:hypothetical protein
MRLKGIPMKNNNIDLDNLIDSAMSKVRLNTPQLSKEPDPSLVSKLKTGAAESNASISTSRFLHLNIASMSVIKFSALIIATCAILTVMYFLSPFSQREISKPKSESIITATQDSLVKHRSDSIINVVNDQKHKVVSPLIQIDRKEAQSDSVRQEKNQNAGELLPPVFSKTTNNDSIKVPFNKIK